MLKPELCTLHVLCEMRSLSADAVTLDIAIFLGVTDRFVELAWLKAVFAAFAVAKDASARLPRD